VDKIPAAEDNNMKQIFSIRLFYDLCFGFRELLFLEINLPEFSFLFFFFNSDRGTFSDKYGLPLKLGFVLDGLL